MFTERVNVFSGGYDTPLSRARQSIDVSALAAEIDSGSVLAELSGYFGGYGEQDDRALLTASYLNPAGNTLGDFSVGNVLGADRTSAVPAGTRKIDVSLAMTRTAGTYNDGNADNLSSTTIFDNTSGSDNGGSGVSTTFWLASKFCVGPQTYSLDSVSLL